MMSDLPLVQWQFLQMKKATKKNAPTACFLQSCTQIGSKMLIYGGCNYNGDPVSQLFVYDTITFQWSAPSNASDFQEDHPGNRYGHSATLVEMHPPRIMVNYITIIQPIVHLCVRYSEV
jgi:hypothetical protein